LSDLDEAAGVGHPLTIALPEGPLQVGRFYACASGLSKNRQRRVLLVVALAMRPVRQAVVIADQVAMKFDCGLDALASFPMIFADPGLNAELALNGLITNDKFCLSRPLRLALKPPQRPLTK
jgi:hypothetical protein